MTLSLKDGGALAALLVRPKASNENGLWVLHLHGNATSAFERGQAHHCEQLSAAGSRSSWLSHTDSAALVLFGAFTSIDDVAAVTYP